MKLIIDIPEEAYKLRVCNPVWFDSNMDKAIRNGTPLEEELEKIREKMIEKCKEYRWDNDDIVSDSLIRIIDNRIEELKGEQE